MKTKHKLSGYAIKGDGTRETADRIRKVFEADGWNVSDWTFETDNQYGCPPVGQLEVDPIGEGREYGNPYTVIPLTEAEALVFGELKEGMKVVALPESSGYGMYEVDEGKIFEIVERKEHLGYDSFELKPVNHEPETFGRIYCRVQDVRRATITDFLRTLPEDIAERALKQVESDVDYQSCDSLAEAISCGIEWVDSEEGDEYWSEVEEGNYGRARAILAEKDRVGKWWYVYGGLMFVTSDNEGVMYGYGVDQEGDWFDHSKQTGVSFTGTLKTNKPPKMTPATPEEVKKVLDAERVKRGLVEGAVVKSAVGSNNKIIKTGAIYLNNHTEMYDGDGTTCLMKNGKWAEIITPAPSKPEPKPTDNFPRVMWVVAAIGQTEYLAHVTDNPHKNKGLRADKWFVYGKSSFIECTGSFDSLVRIATPEEVQEHFDRMDTHPVTGEPAQQKSVVEQIREVYNKAAKMLRDADNDSMEVAKYNAAFMDGVEFSTNEIKEILKNK